MEEQDIVYECPVCSEQYDEENIWIECELYEHWYHLQCTMIHQYNNLENIEFICIACQRVQLQQQKCMMLLYDIMCTKYRNVHQNKFLQVSKPFVGRTQSL